MKPATTITLGVLVIAFAALPFFGQATGGWTTLFDGKNISNFNAIGNANWEIKDGAVQANMGTGFLVTKASYTDFEVKVEFWVDADANSGVFIRCENPQEVNAMNAYEVNIYDKRPDQAGRTGAIVDVAKPLAVIDAGGKWNTFEISAKGPRLIVTLNGTKTVDVENKAHARGNIALQYGAGTVKFRSVQVRTQ